MRKMLCPQCKIAAMYVKNEAGDRRFFFCFYLIFL